MLSNMTDERANPEQRAFYLSLDPEAGQTIAESAGFVPPSKGVMIKEQQEVIKGWMKLSALGVTQSIDDYTDWYLEVLGTLLGIEVSEGIREGYGESIRQLVVAILLGLRRKELITVANEDELEFHALLLDETGEVVKPDAELHGTIAELEKAWHLELDEEETDG